MNLLAAGVVCMVAIGSRRPGWRGLPLVILLAACFAAGWLGRRAGSSLVVGGRSADREPSRGILGGPQLRGSATDSPRPASSAHSVPDVQAPPASLDPSQQALLRSIVSRWTLDTAPTPGIEVQCAVMGWRSGLPLSPDAMGSVLPALLSDEIGGGGGAVPSRSDAERAIREALSATRAPWHSYVLKTYRFWGSAWSLTAQGWPEGSVTSRARVDGNYYQQVTRGGSRDTSVIASDEYVAYDSFGNFGPIRYRQECRRLARFVALLGAENRLTMSEVFQTPEGRAVTMGFPLAPTEGGRAVDVPFAIGLPPYLVAGTKGRLGSVRMTVLLERGALPAHVVLLNRHARVVGRWVARDFMELPDGEFVPRFLDRVSYYPDGRTPYSRHRSGARVTRLADDIQPLEFIRGKRTTLRSAIGGCRARVEFTDDGRTSLRSQVRAWAREAAARREPK